MDTEVQVCLLCASLNENGQVALSYKLLLGVGSSSHVKTSVKFRMNLKTYFSDERAQFIEVVLRFRF